MREVRELLDHGDRDIDVRLVVGMIEEGTKWMQWPADGGKALGFRQPDFVACNMKIDSHCLSIFLGSARTGVLAAPSQMVLAIAAVPWPASRISVI